jgi:hypothetical protein
MQHFRSSMAVAAVGLILGFYIGGLEVLYIVALLAVLEISLSFDNAVVNVKVLETMEEKWQKRFILFGIPIAVFGMRFLFPILIVAIASGLSISNTFNLALHNPLMYNETLHSVEKLIFAFGGAFLLMVFLNFIFDIEREEKWIKMIEESKFINRMGKLNSIKIIIAVTIGVMFFLLIKGNYEITLAYFIGILLYTIISSVDNLLGVNGVRNGIMGFLYLEILDASFSFDGVIGAFALSSDIFVIMIGLGIGAMFVRALTLYMLAKKTLTEYRYLEHGAHYAVLALAIIMLVKIFTPVNEIVVGTVGVSFIVAAIYHSVRVNRRVKVLIEN